VGGTGASGASGSGGAGAGGAAGTTVGPRGRSAGCGLPPGSNDSSTTWTKHDVTAVDVDPKFVAAHPPDPAGGAYTWTHRNYYLKLPSTYNPTKAYVLSLGGTGCSGNDMVGSGGGYYLDQYVAASKPEVIDVSLSYVVYTNTSKPSCFADDYTNSPEPAYLDAVVADLESKYCVDQDKIFLHGHSSGAWEALTLGCARADVLRGVATQVGGGLRMHRPPCQKTPIATIYVEGLQDTDNPIGPLAPTDPKALDLDSLGSAPARDDLLTRNGCVGSATKVWDPAFPACLQYTGCPAAGPVVWCAIDSTHDIGANTALRNQYAYNAIWKFWSTLPSP
jgi:poly(3-hydroxybutyrate) depolymerase